MEWESIKLRALGIVFLEEGSECAKPLELKKSLVYSGTEREPNGLWSAGQVLRAEAKDIKGPHS